MIPDPTNVSMQELQRQLDDIQAFLTRKFPDYDPARVDVGVRGSVTGSEPVKHIGWIVPTGDYANVRIVPTAVKEQDIHSVMRNERLIIAKDIPDATGMRDKNGRLYTWYQIDPESFVRDDVAEFHRLEDGPPSLKMVTPAPSTGKWPAPLNVWVMTNDHGHNGHNGVDLAAPMGTNIVNHLDAFVLRAFDCVECKVTGDGPQSINVDHLGDGYGTFAILRYDSWSVPLSAQPHVERFIFVLYGHMSDLDVTQGFPVRADSRIGRVGSTGNSTGPHLHLEVRTSDTPNVNFYAARLIDPELIFDL